MANVVPVRPSIAHGLWIYDCPRCQSRNVIRQVGTEQWCSHCHLRVETVRASAAPAEELPQ